MLPATARDLSELDRLGLLQSSPDTLEMFGFGRSHAFCAEEFEERLVAVARQALRRSTLAPDQVSWLLVYSGLPAVANGGENTLHLFRYPVSRVHYELGLTNARMLALSQQGCTGLLASLDLANRLLRSDSGGAALCITGDVLPPHAKREIMYSLMSDAVAATVVTPAAGTNRILAFFELRQTYFWDPSIHADELLAAYFPLAQRTIQRCLQSAMVSADEIRWFVPHNVSVRSWEILARLIGVPSERIWMNNIARVGHTISCDHIINLSDMEDAGALTAGDLLLLFTFGFGASWSCLLLEH